MVKLVLSWNIKADEETAYFEFVTQEFVPGVLRLGIRPVEACDPIPMIVLPSADTPVAFSIGRMSTMHSCATRPAVPEYSTG